MKLMVIGVVLWFGGGGGVYESEAKPMSSSPPLRLLRVQRSATSDDNLMMDHAESSLDRLNINYDEYPVSELYTFLRIIAIII